MALAPTSVTFGDLTIDDVGDYHLTNIAGWDGLPEARYDSIGRPASHGEFDGPVYAAARVVHLEGECYNSDQRDTLLQTLSAGAGFAGNSAARDLVVTFAGRTLTSQAKIIRYSPTVARGDWGTGWFGWQADFRCADPLRYGDPASSSTVMPVDSGGLDFPIGSVFDFGTLGSTGTIDLLNSGSADTPIMLRIDGPTSGTLAGGFLITETQTGSRLQYDDDLVTGTWVTFDPSTGRVTLNDTADRRGSVSVAQFGGFTIPSNGFRQVKFEGVSSSSATALLTATIRPANW
jgi:hypothetical protein